MRRRIKTKIGDPPGTFNVPAGAKASELSLIAYNEKDIIQKQKFDLAELDSLRTQWKVLWVNVDGLGTEAIVLKLAEQFRIHHLATEDIANLYQRPKFETYDDHDFLVFRMPSASLAEDSEQISMIVGQGFVLTFQESPGDCLDGLRNRILQAKGQVRRRDANYLGYCIIDSIVDSYFPRIETVGETLGGVEQQMMALQESPSGQLLLRLQEIKKQLLHLRRDLWPMRELTNQLLRDGGRMVSRETAPYFRDCTDHVVRMIEIIEIYRENVSDLIDTYHSLVNNSTNQVMKVLTVISTIFIPLTFLTSLYGMNFDGKVSPWNMPELRWYFGYPAIVVSMLLSAIFMFWFFRRKKWL